MCWAGRACDHSRLVGTGRGLIGSRRFAGRFDTRHAPHRRHGAPECVWLDTEYRTGRGLTVAMGASGLVAYVLIGPLSSFLLGHWYVSRLPKVAANPIAIKKWRISGKPCCAWASLSWARGWWVHWCSFGYRVEVGNTLGAESLGHFQAAWTISMQYIGFVLGAMGADYYPRLTGVIHDHKAATRLVNEQTEIALLLSAPVFIAMIGLTPWVIHLLYSSAFAAAVEVLRWQILGDVLKVASWPLGFVILAAGAGKTFFLTETIALVVMGGLIAGFSGSVGLQITGIAFLWCYLVYLPLVYWAARLRIRFSWTGGVVKLMLIAFILCAAVAVTSSMYWWGAGLAVVLSVSFALYTLGRLTHMSDFGGPVGRINKATLTIIEKYKSHEWR